MAGERVVIDEETAALIRALGVEPNDPLKQRPKTQVELDADPDYQEWLRERRMAGLMSVKVHRKRRANARKALTSRDIRGPRNPDRKEGK